MNRLQRHHRNILCALALISAIVACSAPLFSCDDTVLALISGRDPSDEFSAALLDMVRNLQKAASAINAFDVRTAEHLMASIMAAWLNFTNRYRAAPPAPWANDPLWDSRIIQVSDLLGRLRTHFISGRPGVSHDMIEGIATQMTLISTRAAGVSEFNPVLEAEWELLGLNPALPENAEAQALLTRISSFSSTMHALKATLSQDLESLHTIAITGIGHFRQASTDAPSPNSPRPIRAYANLVAAFTDMRASLLATKTK